MYELKKWCPFCKRCWVVPLVEEYQPIFEPPGRLMQPCIEKLIPLLDNLGIELLVRIRQEGLIRTQEVHPYEHRIPIAPFEMILERLNEVREPALPRLAHKRPLKTRPHMSLPDLVQRAGFLPGSHHKNVLLRDVFGRPFGPGC